MPVIDDSTSELIEYAARITPQWLAGFFDGEGSISVYKSSVSGLYALDVSITQCDSKLISLIGLKFSPCSGPRQRKSSFGTNRKPAFVVSWSGGSSLKILHYIKDHVIRKKIQVETAIRLAEIIRTGRYSGSGGVDDNIKSQRESLGKLILEANRA